MILVARPGVLAAVLIGGHGEVVIGAMGYQVAASRPSSEGALVAITTALTALVTGNAAGAMTLVNGDGRLRPSERAGSARPTMLDANAALGGLACQHPSARSRSWAPST